VQERVPEMIKGNILPLTERESGIFFVCTLSAQLFFTPQQEATKRGKVVNFARQSFL
jgi:hypothetical protein